MIELPEIQLARFVQETLEAYPTDYGKAADLLIAKVGMTPAAMSMIGRETVRHAALHVLSEALARRGEEGGQLLSGPRPGQVLPHSSRISRVPERAGAGHPVFARESPRCSAGASISPPAKEAQEDGSGQNTPVATSDLGKAVAPKPLPNPSIVTARSVAIANDWTRKFAERRFNEISVNGQHWWYALPAESLRASERHKTHGRFLDFVARACPDPRKPIGEQLSDQDFEAAVTYAEQPNV